MTRRVHLPQDLCHQALDAAIHEGFPEVIRIVRLFKNGQADLLDAEGEHLLSFARFLVLRAELHYPHWDDSGATHSQHDEDMFHAINMGLHEKIVSSLAHAFPKLFGD